MIRACLPLTVCLAAMLPGAALAQIAPCDVAEIHRPAPGITEAPPNAAGCERGAGLVAGMTRLFRCQVLPESGEADIPESSPEYVFLLDRAGQERLVLPDSLMAGRFDAFEVYVVDLDGDQQPEHVLAAWSAQGNGLGVNRWTIRVFDADWTLISTFEDVADWGDSSLVEAAGSRSGCDLAITGFVEHTNAKGRPGTAFEARFFRREASQMVQAEDRPTLTRRYTFSFQDQRTAHFEAGDFYKGDVAAWLSHPSTEKR